MNRLSRKNARSLAVILNTVSITLLITVLVKFPASLLLTTIFAALTHICLCGSLLYFLYISPADVKKPVDSAADTMSYFAVPASK